jgi:hypothetical protein
MQQGKWRATGATNLQINNDVLCLRKGELVGPRVISESDAAQKGMPILTILR